MKVEVSSWRADYCCYWLLAVLQDGHSTNTGTAGRWTVKTVEWTPLQGDGAQRPRRPARPIPSLPVH